MLSGHRMGRRTASRSAMDPRPARDHRDGARPSGDCERMRHPPGWTHTSRQVPGPVPRPGGGVLSAGLRQPSRREGGKPGRRGSPVPERHALSLSRRRRGGSARSGAIPELEQLRGFRCGTGPSGNQAPAAAHLVACEPFHDRVHQGHPGHPDPQAAGRHAEDRRVPDAPNPEGVLRGRRPAPARAGRGRRYRASAPGAATRWILNCSSADFRCVARLLTSHGKWQRLAAMLPRSGSGHLSASR